MNILALSGSLRVASENTRLLRALAQLAPPGIKVQVYSGLGELPLFNPDIEFPNPPAVAALREAINAADAVVIASPEYAHGVTAVIKNALDWMVGNESFVNKPVALLNAAPRATHAYLALRETVTMMSARVVEPACITLTQPITGMTEQEIAAHSQHRAALEGLLAVFVQDQKIGERHVESNSFSNKQGADMTLLPPLNRSIGAAERSMQGLLARELDGMGLNFPEWTTLGFVATTPLLVEEISSRHMEGRIVATPAISKEIVEGLMRRGLVCKGATGKIQHTENGQQVFLVLSGKINQIIHRLYGDLPSEDIVVTHRTLLEISQRAARLLSEGQPVK